MLGGRGGSPSSVHPGHYLGMLLGPHPHEGGVKGREGWEGEGAHVP